MLKRACKISPTGWCNRREAKIPCSVLPCGDGESYVIKQEVCDESHKSLDNVIITGEYQTQGADSVEIISHDFSTALLLVNGVVIRAVNNGEMKVII